MRVKDERPQAFTAKAADVLDFACSHNGVQSTERLVKNMKTNFYKNRAIKQKWVREGIELAELRTRTNEKALEYCGNEKVAKYQRHTGEFVYLMTEDVLKEFIDYWYIINEAIEAVFNWHMGAKCPLTPTQKMFMEFIAECSPEKENIYHIINAFRGSPMMSFYFDKEARERQSQQQAKREKVQKMWAY